MEAERKSKSNKLKLTPRSIGFPSHSMDGVWSEGTDTRNHRVLICHGTSLDGSEKKQGLKRELAAQVRSENSGYARPRTKNEPETSPTPSGRRGTDLELDGDDPAAARPVPPYGEHGRTVARESRQRQPPGAEAASSKGRKGGGGASEGRHGWMVGFGSGRGEGVWGEMLVQCAERSKGVGMVI